MPMATFTLTDDLPGGHIESSEQRGGAVANVVVSHSLDIAKAYWQQGLSAVERLDLRFFVHAQHERFVGGIEIQPDDIPEFFNEEGIGGEFEMSLTMRLQSEGLPDTVDRGLGYIRYFRDGTAAPVGAVRRLGFQRLADQRRNLLVGNRTWTSRTKLIVESLDASFEESPTPFTNAGLGEVELLCNSNIGHAIGSHQDDARPAD